MITSEPQVTVVIPTHNRAGLIGRSVKSVLAQTYDKYKIIVVDDCSSDNTEEVIQSIKDERIEYVRHNKNKGVSAARNTGIRLATTRYLAFLDDDDEFLPLYLEKQINKITSTKEQVGVVYTDLLTGNIRTTTKKEGDVHKVVMRLQFNCQVGCFLIKSACFEKVGLFDEELVFAEDVDMCIRLSRHYHFKHVDEALVIRHYTEGALCSNMDTFINGFKVLLNKHFTELSSDRTALSRFYLHIGHFLVSKGATEEGHRYFIDAVKTDPLNIKAIGASLVLSMDKNKYGKIYQTYMNHKHHHGGN